MAPTLANRKNTETKDTHAQPSSRATQGTIKGPQPWVAERTLKQRTHTRTPIKQSYAGATKGPQPWQAERALIQRTHTHTPQAKLHRGHHMASTLARRETLKQRTHTHTNTHTHTHTPQAQTHSHSHTRVKALANTAQLQTQNVCGV